MMIFFALLRPQWHKHEEVVIQEGRDLLIALDISRSMLANDCKPSRLFCAKNKIKNHRVSLHVTGSLQIIWSCLNQRRLLLKNK